MALVELPLFDAGERYEMLESVREGPSDALHVAEDKECKERVVCQATCPCHLSLSLCQDCFQTCTTYLRALTKMVGSCCRDACDTHWLSKQ